MIDLLRCHDERLEKPSFYQILEAAYYERPIRCEDAYQGRIPEILARKPYTFAAAVARARKLEQSYVSLHCHVFCQPGFAALWADLVETGLVPLKIEEIGVVPDQSNEFHVLFSRGRPPAAAGTGGAAAG